MTQRRCWRCCGFVVLFRFEVEYARRVIGLLVFVYVVFERNVKAVIHEIFAAEGEAIEGQRLVFVVETSTVLASNIVGAETASRTAKDNRQVSFPINVRY